MSGEKVLIITKSDDNACIDDVSRALLARGAVPVRLNTDLYPTRTQISTELGNRQAPRRVLRSGDVRVDLDEVAAVWYRRFYAGRSLPHSLGDTRPACVGEVRRTLFGMIAALDCFHLDPLENVRRCDHKELQLRRAAELGLDIPRTLFSNDPDEVRAFFDVTGGRMISKMQHSFAIYREGIENVVFTNVIAPGDLEDLSGLAYCPMVFQEHLDKDIELRVTVVGQKVMAAAIDSQKWEHTKTDWRRDGIGLLHDWTPTTLPPDVEQGLLRLVSEIGLNYAAADFVITRDGRCVFLEVNAVGEFYWLEKSPGLPIVDSIAQVLLGHAPRLPIAIDAWRNHT